ncbi:MAG TPA: hypothetical protein VKZ63_11035 [Kofleriaceae bacterium]|nr:hypothetical protein [Kofleriaceae bacterium]
MSRRLLIALSAPLCLGLLGLAITACGTREDAGEDPAGAPDKPERRVTELTEPREALSQELMLALALAQNHHHKADVYLADARVEEAMAEVRQILHIRFPEGSPEGEDVKLDARARLGKLLVTQGELDEAMAVVDAGISSASRPSFFLGNLHTVRGEVWEARAATLEEEDPDAARQARREALLSYERAIEIEKPLQEELMRRRKAP